MTNRHAARSDRPSLRLRIGCSDRDGRLWDACGMPWAPELFSAPVVQQFLDERRRDKLVAVPYFDGFLAGEPDAMVESFAGEPLLYDPVRGRVKGVRAFKAFAAHVSEWLVRRAAPLGSGHRLRLAGGGFEGGVLHLDGGGGRGGRPVVALPHPEGGRRDRRGR